MKATNRWWWAVLFSIAVHAVSLGVLGWLLSSPDRPSRPVIDSAVSGNGEPMNVFLGTQRRPAPPAPLPPSLDGPPTDQELQLVKVESVRPAAVSGGVGPVVEQPGHGGGASQGGPAAFFAVPVRGRSVVYLIDRSLSMGVSGALARAREEMLASLRALPSGTRFQVFLYNRGAEPLMLGRSWGLLELSDDVLAQVQEKVRTVRGEGGTNHILALERGLALRPDVLFLVTDADDLSDRQVQAITRSNAGHTIIHTIDLGTGQTFAPALQRLARDNRGMYVRRGEQR